VSAVSGPQSGRGSARPPRADRPGDGLQAPDATFVRQRWIPANKVEWAAHAHDIMVEHGAVQGQGTYDQRYKARWKAQYLIKLLCELNFRERWELREHTYPRSGGWAWTVEYIPPGGNRAES